MSPAVLVVLSHSVSGCTYSPLSCEGAIMMWSTKSKGGLRQQSAVPGSQVQVRLGLQQGKHPIPA